jgi:hypothetical protein
MAINNIVRSKHYIFFLAAQLIIVAGCTPHDALSMRTTGSSGSGNGDDYIRLTQEEGIRAILKSSPDAATFKITGLGLGSDVILPATTVAKVTLPKLPVTITASTRCYPDIVHYLQIGEQNNGIDINFAFSNANRKVDCDDEEISPPEAPEPSQSSPDSRSPGSPQKLAWVITNSDYGDNWTPLSFVENDRDRIIRTFGRAGYKVIVSHNTSRDRLLTDEAGFRRELAGQTWNSVIVYISGHGIGLHGENFLVPIDAPGINGIKPADLFDISRIASDLDPIADAGAFALVLVDACRFNPEFAPDALSRVGERGVLVNYSAAPGSYSFAGDIGMSFWTQRFVELADAYPGLPTDHIVRYANAYTKWQSETSPQVQSPVLVGRVPASVPMFGTRNLLSRGVILVPIPSNSR